MWLKYQWKAEGRRLPCFGIRRDKTNTLKRVLAHTLFIVNTKQATDISVAKKRRRHPNFSVVQLRGVDHYAGAFAVIPKHRYKFLNDTLTSYFQMTRMQCVSDRPLNKPQMRLVYGTWTWNDSPTKLNDPLKHVVGLVEVVT